MPDDYRRPTSAFLEEWRTVMLATQATLSRYRSHCIRFTVNPVALAEATRQSEFKQRKKAVDRANSQDRRKGGSIWQLSTPNHTTIRKGKQMNESTTVTIGIDEYKELLMSRIKLNTLAAYVDSANRKNAPCFDSEYISFILGVPARGVK